jgi:rSAM/selenodomain-associated transferase 1
MPTSPLDHVALCILAKVPEAGRVKTRLAEAVGTAVAVRLAQAFLADTVELASLVCRRPVLVLDGDPAHLRLAHPPEIAKQREGDLGARMEHALGLGLQREPLALVIGTDSPGLPRAHLEQAAEALAAADTVLGPSPDGGFYVIGARRPLLGVLSDIVWSQATTLCATRERLEAADLSVAFAPIFEDVDTLGDLKSLVTRLKAGTLSAPHTLQVLAELRSLGMWKD